MDIDEEEIFSYIMIIFFVIAVLILAIKGKDILMLDKEFKKQQEDLALKIEQCKKGKVISIDEENTTAQVKNHFRRPGQIIPGSYEQTIVVPQFYVKLDNGITLVSRDADLKVNSVIGKPVDSKYCNEEVIR